MRTKGRVTNCSGVPDSYMSDNASSYWSHKVIAERKGKKKRERRALAPRDRMGNNGEMKIKAKRPPVNR